MRRKQLKRKLWKILEDYNLWYPRKMKEWEKERANEFFREVLELIEERRK
jgi:hypothetical protein